MSKQEFLSSAGLQVQTLDFWLEQRWLIPEQTAGGANFSDMDVARAHFIRDLKADFGVNDEGVDVILHLVDQLHGLRRALEQLRGDLPATRP
ncbi:chaperone modulator CbpM [Bradyrhizobium canariense]|nr:chaperone modulator CbpM [Bradyrhizobium canariense]